MNRLLDLSESEYHKHPGLSASAAKVLVEQSPLHAMAYRESPRDPSAAFDLGHVGHRLLLGKGKEFQVVDADDWRTKKAQGDRAAIIAAGETPILVAQYERAVEAAAAVRAQLIARDIDLTKGTTEQGIEWVEQVNGVGAVLCRGKLDWIRDRLILDLKTCASAASAACERSMNSYGYDIQHAAYISGANKVWPENVGRFEMRFVFFETEPPFAVNIIEPDGMLRELGERRWSRAVRRWGECQAAGRWPGYEGVNRVTAQSWRLSKEMGNDE